MPRRRKNALKDGWLRMYGYFQCPHKRSKKACGRTWQSSHVYCKLIDTTEPPSEDQFTFQLEDEKGGPATNWVVGYAQLCGRCKGDCMPNRVEPIRCKHCGETLEHCDCYCRRCHRVKADCHCCVICNQLPKNCVCCKRCNRRRRLCRCCKDCRRVREDCRCERDADGTLIRSGTPPIERVRDEEEEEARPARKVDSGRPHLAHLCRKCLAGDRCVYGRARPRDNQEE